VLADPKLRANASPDRKQLAPVLEVRGLTVRYGSATALSNFSFAVTAGQVTAIIGPNGSGKTTCLNALTGVVSFASGEILVRGQAIRKITPRRMFQLGVTRTFQNLDLIDELSVADNIGVGARVRTNATFVEATLGAPRARMERKQRQEAARAAAARVGVSDYLGTGVADLAYGIRRRAEVARAIASSPAVLLLDEPTAGMGPTESADFALLITQLAAERSMAIVIIEHDMRVVRQAADHVWVLGGGELIASGPPEQVLDEDVVVNTYLGVRGDL
jgi:branched-chain amino acid transport system ATP-binding protein